MGVEVKKIIFVVLMLMYIQNLFTTCAASSPENISQKVTTFRTYRGSKLSKTENNVDLMNYNHNAMETHYVTTEDGYILTVVRIPGPPGSVPVLMQHGFLGTMETWTISNHSLAGAFSDNGYDVWLGNSRGSKYSRKHQTLSTSDPKFWNFSWHELGMYDVPAMINYITEIKNDNLIYVGHSLGGEIYGVMATERQDVAKKVKAGILLAPAVYMYHSRSPLLGTLGPIWSLIQEITNALGIYELLPRSVLFDSFAKNICGSVVLRHAVCANIMFILAGYNPDQLDDNLLTDIFNMFPGGSSVKTLIHVLQQININEFRKLDYGTEDNLIMYNSSVPPNYDLSKIQIPTAVFYSKNDRLVHEDDVLHFYEQVPNKLGSINVDDMYTHIDIVLGKDNPKLLFGKIFELMAAQN